MHSSNRSVVSMSKSWKSLDIPLTTRQLATLADAEPPLLRQPPDLAAHRLARDAGRSAYGERIARPQVRQVLAGGDQRIEPLGRMPPDLVVVPLHVVLGDRGQHDRGGQVALEQLVDTDQVLGHEPAGDVRQFAMTLADAAAIDHECPVPPGVPVAYTAFATPQVKHGARRRAALPPQGRGRVPSAQFEQFNLDDFRTATDARRSRQLDCGRRRSGRQEATRRGPR